MRPVDYLRLFVLAAIWGGSFIFMRVVAPAFGPMVTADLRILIAGLVLLVYFRAIGFDAEWRKNLHHYAIVGLANSGIPFICYSFAALHLPAAYSAIINSLTPLFGAICGVLWLGERFTPSKVAGLVLGVLGVALVAYKGGAPHDPLFGWAVLACVAATICYALSGVYLKRVAKHLKPLALAGCSQLAAGVLLLPSFALQPPPGPITTPAVLCLLALAILASAIAYVLYYRLMADIGPTRALTVTFLVPGFGMLWGALFLREPVTGVMLAGFALVVLGTLAVAGTLSRLFSPARA
jgi:drug/metabolite transporter (DMT)-like permease